MNGGGLVRKPLPRDVRPDDRVCEGPETGSLGIEPVIMGIGEVVPPPASPQGVGGAVPVRPGLEEDHPCPPVGEVSEEPPEMFGLDILRDPEEKTTTSPSGNSSRSLPISFAGRTL
jgi:hypothetical protein